MSQHPHPLDARKGDLVTTTEQVLAVYTMSETEVAAWYAAQVGYDAHGESLVCSGNRTVKVEAGTTFVVVRARCTAEVGWSTRPGFVEVQNTATGVVLKVPRSALRSA
jgi:hypothetical protein